MVSEPIKISTKPALSDQDAARLIYLKIFLVISLAGYLLAWANATFVNHTINLATSLFILILGLISLSALVVTAVTKKTLWGRLVLHFSLIAIVIYAMLNTQYGLYWVFVGPVIIVLIENQTAAAVIFSLYLCVMLAVQFQPFIESRYDNQSVVTAAVSIFLIGIYLFLYKRKYDQNTLSVYEKEQKLEAITKQLSEEVASKTRHQSELSASMSDLSRHNQLLTDSRVALANVLEDEKELRQELELAKEGVELKVKQRTAQLHEEHARLHATVESLPVGLAMLDSKLKLVSSNRTINRLMADIVVKNTTLEVDDFIFNKLKIKDQVKACLDQKKSTLINETDYENKVLRVYIAPIMVNTEERTAGVVVIIEDITEEKVMERSKEEFLSIASHELRTPLTAIRGNAKLLDKVYKNRMNDPIFNELTKDISLSSERLIGIVNDYLETSSLEQSKIIIKPQFFSIDELVMTTIHELSSAARDKGVYLNLAKHDQTIIPPVYADTKRVSQVLVNLISNGLHYTKKGGVTISIVPRGLDQVAVAVSDTGIGISEKNKKLLFHKFQKADDNILTRDWKRSTGLGLYIAKLLTELMGGTIELEQSKVNQGSSFVFTLPTKPLPAK